MSAVTRTEVLERLRQVPEPCSILMRTRLDIVEMGLVDEIDIDADGCVRVVLVLTDPSCVHFLSMRRYITDVLLEHPGIRAVDVVMSTDELWTPERMEGVA